jgi:hypothetical protein
MNKDVIDKAFADLIFRRGVHQKLRIKSNYIRQLRRRLKFGAPISTDLKLRLLQKSGWIQDQAQYTLQDLVSLLKFYQRTSQAARDMGEEYVIEKWKLNK